MGTAVVVLLYVALLVRIILLAERQRSTFSRVYGYAIAGILFVHVAINIGMTIGLVPVIGIPLPFLSYGGSSMLAFTMMLAIFVKQDANRLNIL
jgi:rod shape determining protein RodA